MGYFEEFTKEDCKLAEQAAAELYGRQLIFSCLFPKMKGVWKYCTIFQYFLWFALNATNSVSLLITILLSWKDKDLIIIFQSSQYLLLNIIASVIFVSYNIHRSEFARIHRIMNTGCYMYDQITQSSLDQSKTNLKTQKKIVYAIASLYIFISGTVIVFFGPLADYLLGKLDQTSLYTKNGISLNLPIACWSPIGTGTKMTFVISIVFQLGSHILNALIFNVYLTSFFVILQHLNYEMRLLIQTLIRVEERCLLLYNSEFKQRVTISDDNLINDERLCLCYYDCLKESVQHHHKVLLLHKDAANLLTMSFFIMSLAVSMVIAASGILIIFGNERISALVPAVLLLLGENLTVFSMCWSGENIKLANEELKLTLYTTRWYLTNKKLCKILDIMMISTEKPLIIYFNYLTKLPTTLETFTIIINTAYTYFNLLFAFKEN